MKKIYALCVGINIYKSGQVGDLSGCENDARQMVQYLKQASENTDYSLEEVLLINEAATKSNIVDGFLRHLNQATADDIALFYFSGHGAEEQADEVFHTFSHTNTLTTLVCHDSRLNGVTDLADKELRYLVHTISHPSSNNDNDAALPHIVLITDSCHSGGVTRSKEMKPRLTGKTNQREWKDFIFANEISRASVANAAALEEVLPEGEHIHMSSCEDGELAYEVDGSGIFTAALLDILKRTSGNATYLAINNRTRAQIGERYPQRPTLYSTNNEWVNLSFLGGAVESDYVTTSIYFKSSTTSWRMDLGVIHGVSDDANAPTQVTIRTLEGEQAAYAEVRLAQSTHSDLAINEVTINGGRLNKKEIYVGVIEGLFRNHVNYYLTGEQEGLEVLHEYFQSKTANAKANNPYYQLVDQEVDAQYVIRAVGGAFLLTFPFKHRPLVRQLLYHGKNTIANLTQVYFEGLAKWEFMRALHNEKSRLKPEPPVEIRLYRVSKNGNSDEYLQPINDSVEIHEGDSVRIQVVNQHRRKKMYYALLYLDMQFGIQLLSARNSYLNPQKSYWVAERAAIPVFLEPEVNHSKKIFEYLRKFNFEVGFFVLKLICSTQPIQHLEAFETSPLPTPIYPLSNIDLDERKLKRRSEPESTEWATHSITVYTPNPDYKEEMV